MAPETEAEAMTITLDDLLADPTCSARAASLFERLGPGSERLVVFFCDPLMSVDLRDKRWPEKFDTAHPTRRRFP